MSAITHPLMRALAAALLVACVGVPLMVLGTLLWTLNALMGVATWENVGYELGYHGTWLIWLTLGAGGAGMVCGLCEVVNGLHRGRS